MIKILSLPSLFFLLRLFLAAALPTLHMLLLDTAPVQAKDNQDGIIKDYPDYPDYPDYLNPSAFVFLEEQTMGGKIHQIPPEKSIALIDKDSRLRVRFHKEILERGINFDAMQKKWQELTRSPEYKDLQERLNKTQAQSKEEEEKKQIEQLIATIETQFLIEAVGYQISVSAWFLPKEGRPFPLPLEVEGYTKVKVTTDEKPSKSTHTVESTKEQRLFRLNLQNDKLMLDDNISDAAIELATFNLPKKLDQDDRVRVTVTNYHSLSPKSLTWELEVYNMGIQTEQDPTLLLVKRWSNTNTNPNPVSETAENEKSSSKLAGSSKDKDLENNFKPAPGTSLLFKFTTRSRIWNFISPAIGINASFLDFRTDKDLEIGIGPVLSLLDGMIQFASGWNLNLNSNRFYWAIGIGFLDISERIKKQTSK